MHVVCSSVRQQKQIKCDITELETLSEGEDTLQQQATGIKLLVARLPHSVEQIPEVGQIK